MAGSFINVLVEAGGVRGYVHTMCWPDAIGGASVRLQLAGQGASSPSVYSQGKII